MPQLANITIKDGAVVPADRTFAPVKTDGNLAVLRERVGVSPDAYPQLSISVRDPSKAQPVYVVEEKIKVPVTGLVDGVTKVIRYNEALVKFFCHRESDEQERKNLRCMVASLAGHAATIAAVEKLEPQY